MQTAGDDVSVHMFVVGDAVFTVTYVGGSDRTRMVVGKCVVGSVGAGVVGVASVVYEVVVVRYAVVIVSFGGSAVSAVRIYTTAESGV